MAIISLDTIKSFFERLDKPTSKQFIDTWDSFWHKLEKIPVSAIDGLQSLISGKAETSDLLGEIQARETADAALQTAISNQSTKVRGDWDASGGTFPAGTEQEPVRNGYTYRVSGLPTNEKVKFSVDLDSPIRWARAFGQTHIAIGSVGDVLHIYKSTDNGITWSSMAITQQPQFNHYTAHVVIMTESEYYAVSEVWNQSELKWSTVISRTTNGGITWTTTLDQLPAHNSASATLLCVNSELDTNLLLSYYVNTASYIYRVYSQGSIMLELMIFNDYRAVQRIECRESGLHYALVQRMSTTQLYKSTDNCITWQLQSSISETGAHLSFIDNNSAYIVTRESALLRKSTDQLATWITISSIDAAAADSNKKIANYGAASVMVGYGDKVARSVDSGITWTVVVSNIGSVNTNVWYYTDVDTAFIACGRYDSQHGFLYRIADTAIAVPYMIMQNGDYIQYSTHTDAIAATAQSDWFYYDTVNRDLRIEDFDVAALSSTINSTTPSSTKLTTEKAVVDYAATIVSDLKGGVKIIGGWNAATNTPDISNETVAGHTYIVTTAGTTNLGGETSWKIKDWAVKTATGWAKIDNSEVSLLWGQIGGDIANQSDVMPRDLSVLQAYSGDLAETNSIAVRVGSVTYNATLGKMVALFIGLFARLDRNNVFPSTSDNIQTYTANGSVLSINRLRHSGGTKAGEFYLIGVSSLRSDGYDNTVFQQQVKATSDHTGSSCPVEYSVQTTSNNDLNQADRFGVNANGNFFLADGISRYTFPRQAGASVGSSILRLNSSGTALEWVNLYNAWDAVQTVIFATSINYSVTNGTTIIIDMTGNAILNLPTNLAPGMKLRIFIKQDTTSGRLLSFATGYMFPGAIVPSLSASANAVDIIEFLAETASVLHCVNFISDSK